MTLSLRTVRQRASGSGACLFEAIGIVFIGFGFLTICTIFFSAIFFTLGVLFICLAHNTAYTTTSIYRCSACRGRFPSTFPIAVLAAGAPPGMPQAASPLVLPPSGNTDPVLIPLGAAGPHAGHSPQAATPWVAGMLVITACALGAGFLYARRSVVASQLPDATHLASWSLMRLAILLGLFLPLGVLGAYLARSKGQSSKRGFFWCWLTGPIGVIVVTFMPDTEPGDSADVADTPEEDEDEDETVNRDEYKAPSTAAPSLIVVSCPCGHQFKVKLQFAGKRGKCPACGATVTAPDPARKKSAPLDDLG